MVNRFKSNFPREGFAWKYTTLEEFKTLAARHIRQFVRDQVQAIWSKEAQLVRDMLESRSSEPSTIAILGRVSSRDRDHDKPILDSAVCRRMLHAIGKELAIAGCRIMVYDSAEEYAAHDVVSGYMASGAAKPRSIRVRKPLSLQQGPFPGQQSASSSHLFLEEPTPNAEWEIAFVPSIQESDGVLVVGNGQFTLFGGLQAVGAHQPILALAGYGGIAAQVWSVLNGQRYRFANDHEVSVMAAQGNDDAWAAECVRILVNQRERRNALQIWRA
jgi:hypothetical protein